MSIKKEHQFIHDFMDWKDRIISEVITQIDRHEYYNGDDKKAVVSLDDDQIKLIYTGLMKTYFGYKIDKENLIKDESICIFCILNDRKGCLSCLYHDECNDPGSTWDIITDQMSDHEDYYDDDGCNGVVLAIGIDKIMEFLKKGFDLED